MKIKYYYLVLCSIFLLQISAQIQTPKELAAAIDAKEKSSMLYAAQKNSGGGLPVTLSSPEQDCNSAIPVCQNVYTTSASYSGYGTTQEIPGNSCLGSNELNSVWYTFTSSSAGNIAFNITPNVLGQDYDFALYNITGTNCSAINSGALTPIRCNFSATGGVTGLSASGTNASEPASGPNQSTVLATSVGQTYVLIISNYSSSSNGYQLNFTPGTASIFDVTPPTLTSVSAPCGSNVLTLNTSEQVTCASIASNGSDISISGTGGPYTITGANGVNCGSSTAQITFTITPALTGGGPWILNAHSGSDGNSFIDNCGNAMPTTTVSFNVAPATPVITGPANVCKGSTFALSSSSAVSYTWTGAAVPVAQKNLQTISVTANTAGTLNFQLVVSYGACGTATVNKSVTVTDAPIANFTIPSLTVCAGTPVNFSNISTYPCSTGGLGLNQCTCGTFLCNATSNQGTFATYIWTFGDGGTAFYLGGSPASNFSPPHTYASPGTYNISLTASGLINTCSNNKNLTITVLPAAPVLTISPSVTICPAQSTTLTVNGGSSYTWTPGATLSSTSNSATVASPLTTTIYSVSAPGCGSNQTSTVQVTVGGTPPAIGAINGSTLVCPNSVGVTYSVANIASTNYTWLVPVGASITSAPTNSNAITVNFGASAGTISVTAIGTCGTATASINVGLSPSLSLTVTPNNSSICAGGSETLTVSGATSYTWANAATLNSANGSSVIASPTTATTYTVIGATGTCTGSATASISMISGLTLTLTSNTPTVCPGGSALLNAAGATSYTWSNAATLTSPFGAGVTATPLSSTVYTVVGTTGGCTGTGTITVGIGACVSSSCDLSLIRSTLTNAGNIELLGMNNTCSLYFINPQFMSGPAAQAYAQSFGANLISVQSAAENADVLTALTNQGYAGQVIWIGFSDALLEGSFVWYDGAPITYSNWAPGEPNNAGGNENCTQIYPNGSWNDLNCNGYNSLSVIEVNICPQITVVTPPIHCPNTNVVLNASTLFGSPNYTYTWVQSGTETFTNTSTAGNTDVITVTSTAPNTFTVFSEDRYSCPVSAIASLAVNPTPTITANSATICLGQQTATLTANGATTYSWIPGTGLSATSGSVVTGTPSSTQSYTVIGMDGNGCLNGTITDITVNPTPTVTVNSATICSGQTATLFANGAANYTWTPSTALSSSNGATVIANPTITTNYTVTGNNGCSGSATSMVSVNPIPNIYTINTASSCDTTLLNWMSFNNVNSNTADASYANYSVTVNQSGGGMLPHVGMFGVGNFPTQYSVSAAPNSIENHQAGLFTFCFNQPVINPQIALSSIGQVGVPVTVNTSDPYQIIWNGLNMSYPSNTQFIGTEGYTIIRFPGWHTCISFDYLVSESYCTIAFGLMDVNCQKANVCPGTQATIEAHGATTYTWSNSAITPTLITSPSASTQYTVTGTDAFGCIGSSTVDVNVYPVNPITLNSSIICVGQQTATLTANGANNTYTWSPAATLSAANGTLVIANPSTTTTYSVDGTDINNCINTATTSVLVNPTPTVTVNSPSICIGQQTATLTAIGASTYSWSPGTGLNATSGSVVTGTPSSTQDYTITGTDVNGCFNVTTTTITVNPLPIIATTSNSLCAGSSASISVNGANTYSWIPSNTLNSSTNATVSANPTITTTYSVIGMDVNTCLNAATSTVTVFPIPTLTITPSYSICSGTSGTLTVSGATTYTWNASASLSSTSNSIVTCTPNATETYTVIGELNTCTISAVSTITVITTPTLSVNTTSAIICPGGTASLTVTGATNYTWSPAATLSSSTGSLVVASPPNTSTYTVIGANSTCTDTSQVVVTVTTTPVITASSATICSTASANLTANGGVTYTWSPATNLNTTSGSTVISTPPSSINYSVSGSSALGCIGSTSLSVIVIPTPTISITGNPLTICTGSTSTLAASGATNYTWSPTTVSSTNTPITTASPVNTTTYTVTGTNGAAPNLCTSTKTIEIIVRPKIVPIISPNDAICFGQSTTIYAVGGNTYHWNPTTGVSKPNDSTTIVQPIVSTIYTVTVSKNNLCPETATVLVNVNPLPIVDAGRDTTINIDETYVLNGTGNVSVGFLSPDGVPLICNWCPIVEVHPIVSTCYTLEGFTSFGCRNTDEICITVTKFWDLFIPNAFTPNGDLTNDYFMPQGYGLEQINMVIFDRWGVEIFKEDNTKLGWDGKYKGALCPQGIYVYQIETKSLGGVNSIRTGHLTVLPKTK